MHDRNIGATDFLIQSQQPKRLRLYSSDPIQFPILAAKVARLRGNEQVVRRIDPMSCTGVDRGIGDPNNKSKQMQQMG